MGYKILLIGEIGSGKTSFLNLICNYNLVINLGFEAGLEQFHDFQKIDLEPSTSKKKGQTINATMYKTKIRDWPIGIIDTPGFGDLLGIEEDKKTAEKIVASLEEEEYINCVCLVINGRAGRMSGSLHYVLSVVTSILPKSALNNTIVVFTNTSSRLHLNFDITELTQYFGCKISHSFCFENPYCLYENAKERSTKTGMTIELIAEGLKDEFEKTAKVLDAMSIKIKSFQPVHTNNFTQLYEIKKQVDSAILKTLMEYNNQMELEKAIKKQQQIIEAAKFSMSLYDSFETEVERTIQVKTASHNTLCAAPGCYTVCHLNCTLKKSLRYDNIFKNCYCMQGGETCVKGMDDQKPYGCGHDYKFHYHDEIRFKRIEEKVVDEDMKKEFLSAKSKEEAALMAKKALENKREESEKRKKQLSQQLVAAIEEFERVGVIRSYKILLENQLFVIKQYLEAEEGNKEYLEKTKEELEKKIKIIEESMKK